MSNSPTPRIVYCHCAFAQVIPADVKQGVLDRLIDSGVDFECVPDLCEMSARKDPVLSELVELTLTQDVRIAACYPRAVYGLFTAAGVPLPKERVDIVNLRTATVDEATAALLEGKPIAGKPIEVSVATDSVPNEEPSMQNNATGTTSTTEAST